MKWHAKSNAYVTSMNLCSCNFGFIIVVSENVVQINYFTASSFQSTYLFLNYDEYRQKEYFLNKPFNPDVVNAFSVL